MMNDTSRVTAPHESGDAEKFEVDDWGALVDRLNGLLRLRTLPIGMKLFESVEEMEAIPRVRPPRLFTRPTRSWPRPRVSAGR